MVRVLDGALPYHRRRLKEDESASALRAEIGWLKHLATWTRQGHR